MNKIEKWQLIQRQGLPLSIKIKKSQNIIREWYEYYNGDVYVAFSGGKDSTVLLDLVRSVYPEVEGVFVDTGLEYPEIKEFVKTKENITTIRPNKSFKQVLDEYGYPVISKKVAYQINVLKNPNESNKATRKLYLEGIKRDGTKTKSWKLSDKWNFLIDAPFKISSKCCDSMKKEPVKTFVKKTNKKAYVGVMASDSRMRESTYLSVGCFNHKEKICTPLSFWKEKDIWDYIKLYKLPYCKLYDMGWDRTGCMFCMFGIHLEEEPNRFQCMQKTHPKLYKYCMEKLGIKEILKYIGVPYKNNQNKLNDYMDDTQ